MMAFSAVVDGCSDEELPEVDERAPNDEDNGEI
jgi:hypothetical protein